MSKPLQTEMDPRSEGPMKYYSSVCSFVQSFFPEPLVEIFWAFFSVEVRALSDLKSNRVRFLDKKLIVPKVVFPPISKPSSYY